MANQLRMLPTPEDIPVAVIEQVMAEVYALDWSRCEGAHIRTRVISTNNENVPSRYGLTVVISNKDDDLKWQQYDLTFTHSRRDIVDLLNGLVSARTKAMLRLIGVRI
jgi:hypothetical protein